MADSRLETLLAERFSARAFTAKIVPRETIDRILDLAGRAPSWCNTQPWLTIVVSGDALDRFRVALFDHARSSAATWDLDQPRYEGVALERRREAGWALYDAVGVAKGDRDAAAIQSAENFRFFGAPHLVIVTSDRAQGSYGLHDCGGFTSTFLLAARANGVDTIAQASTVMFGDFVREWFSIPDDRTLVCGIAFGYADRTHPANGFRTTRAGAVVTNVFVD